jgi:septum formation protein
MTIILASASKARRAILESAGVSVTVDPAAIDESAVKASLAAERLGAGEMAVQLADMKAARISARHPGLIVLGADQILECDKRAFDKPVDLAEARDQLLQLRGRGHRLYASLVALRDGRRLWQHTSQAVLTMRDFSNGFLEQYLGAIGPAALESVGAYQLEGRGAQLFARIDGDYFTILGLPLLPLLEFLRLQGELPA